VNVTFSGETQVSLVDDPALNINYIVDIGGSGILSTSFDGSDGDCNSTQEIVNSTSTTENLSQTTK